MLVCRGHRMVQKREEFMTNRKLFAAGNSCWPYARMLVTMAAFLASWFVTTPARAQSPTTDDNPYNCHPTPDGGIGCSQCPGEGDTPPATKATGPAPSPACPNGSPTCAYAGGAAGLAIWRVSEPCVNVWLADTPLQYPTSRGKPVRFQLRYKNRQGPQGSAENAQAAIFSVGSHWHLPWRSYLEAIPTESTNFWVYLGDGSARKYTSNKLDYATLSKLAPDSSNNVIQNQEGSSNFFGLTNTIGGVTLYFLTQKQDLYGNTMVFQYLVTNNTIRLDKVLDVDNRSITFEYISAGNYSNVISKVI